MVRALPEKHSQVVTKEPCIRCGKLIAQNHLVSLQTVVRLSKLPPSEYVDTIVQLEGIPRELAQEFVDHKTGHRCVKVEPPCPNCGAALKTWHATGCWACGWRRDLNRQLPDYYVRGSGATGSNG
jgi:hypothetical protein